MLLPSYFVRAVVTIPQKVNGVVLLFVLFLSLGACDTGRLYKVDDQNYAATDEPKKFGHDWQKIELFSNAVILHTHLVRFNFTFAAHMRLENKSTTTLTLETKDVVLYSQLNSTPLEQEKCSHLENRSSIEMTSLTVAPGEEKEITCYFNGAKIMNFTHITESKEQRVLVLEFKNLTLGSATQAPKLNFDEATESK